MKIDRSMGKDKHRKPMQPVEHDPVLSQDQRQKYGDMARDLGYLNKQEVDEFKDPNRAKVFENERNNFSETREGRALDAKRRQFGAEAQGKISRMATERGELNETDAEEAIEEIGSGRPDKRGTASKRSTFFITNNPLAKDK